ncbi:putative ABC multidrug transporter [Naviculisporaceae sp. PSN 640]
MPFSAEDQGVDMLHMNQANFDFNLEFEHLFFSIIPSVLFITASIWRVLSLVRRPTVVKAPIHRCIKHCLIAVHASLQLSLIVLVIPSSLHVSSIFITSAVLNLASSLCVMLLSAVEHSKSPRPSILLSVYLGLTLLFDIVQSRTLFLSSSVTSETAYSGIYTSATGLKAAIILLEAHRKTKYVIWDRKEHSPEETSNLFSLAVFFWVNKLFMDGYSKILTVADPFPLDKSLSSEELHERFNEKNDQARLGGKRRGLVWQLVTTLKVPLLLPVAPRLALLGFVFCQPFFINTLLEHLSRGEVDANVGYGFIGAAILIYSGIAISTALYWYFHLRMLTMARSILVTETYICATRARFGVQDDNAAMTLMSVDIERINQGFRPLHDLWASVIQVAIASWMLYRQLRIVFLAPIVVVLICVAALGFLMSFTIESQRTWMSGVQKRVGVTATNLRVEELAKGKSFRKIDMYAAVIAFTPLMISPPVTFALAQRALDAPRIFTSLSYLLLLANPLANIFQVIPGFMAGLACLWRIETFLESEKRDSCQKILPDGLPTSEKTQDNVPPLPGSSKEPQAHITISDAGLGWEAEKHVLRNINVSIPKSLLTVIIGPVGSAKSTLCKALLGKVPFINGFVSFSINSPRIGFCDQTAFLTNATIRDNITGYSAFDAIRYGEVVQASALSHDLDTLPLGDKTIIGSDGIALSGGQKQRVALARALYLQTDLVILDDVFSSLDADTEAHVFRNVFGPGGSLRRRATTVVLSTHSIQHLPAADHIIALGNGTVLEQGTFEQLTSMEGYVQSLQVHGAADDVKEGLESHGKEGLLSSNEPNPVSHQPQASATALTLPPGPDTNPLRQVGDRTVYKHYAQSMGWLLTVSSLLWAALFGFFQNFPTIWLKYWSDDANSDSPSHTYPYYAGIYALLQVMAMVCLGLLGYSLFIVSVTRAGASLHHKALRTLMRAPLSFFAKTDAGIVTNLFSQDLNLIDTELPDALLNTLYAVFTAFGQAIVLLTSSQYMAISYPFLIGLMWAVQRFYLRTSRQLRLLDLESKSPLYTHFIDTVRGIVTLRACGSIADDIKKSAYLLNTSQRPAYLLFMIQQWLMLVLDMVVMVLATVLTALAVRLHTNSGFTGASLVTLMSFGRILSGTVMFYTKLETSIGAVARLKTFYETVAPEDNSSEDIVPDEEWPRHGVIEFNGVSASYTGLGQEDEVTTPPDLALKKINLHIAAGEKVAICGRTGSGKSSLVALLLKILDPLPSSPTPTIDGTPISKIDRSVLRQRIIAVPQHPVFLPAGSSIRANLDPFSTATEEQCRHVLAAVNLWSSLVEQKGGLDATFVAETLSQGQKQLFSLARALLRGKVRARLAGGDNVGGVLLLDEVSSSVDGETEKAIQRVIEAEFRSYTVVAVSHRLEVVMDFDRVVVMDTGSIVEVGNPRVLARDPGTRFGELVRAAGAFGSSIP